MTTIPEGTMIQEEWRDIPDFKGVYSVSNYGRVKSHTRTVYRHNYCREEPERILKQMTHYKGYKIVFFSRQNKKHKRFVHRLVANAFLKNPKDLPIVNHKNLKKHDNFVLNLEWATAKENTNHYYENRTDSDMKF